MRRNDKEITDRIEITKLLDRTTVCRIAMCDGGKPYIVPVNFAVEKNRLYFHSAKTGKKINILRNNPQVCFEVDVPGGLVEGERACFWGLKYRSVIGFGQAIFLESNSEKKTALDILMRKYSGQDAAFSYTDEALDKVLLIGIQIQSLTGKTSG